MSEEVGSIFEVVRKVRKREPMSDDEVELAKRSIADRGSWMALLHPSHSVHHRMLLRLRQPRTSAWSHALGANISRGDSHVDVHNPGHSAAQERRLETACAESASSPGRHRRRGRRHALSSTPMAAVGFRSERGPVLISVMLSTGSGRHRFDGAGDRHSVDRRRAGRLPPVPVVVLRIPAGTGRHHADLREALRHLRPQTDPAAGNRAVPGGLDPVRCGVEHACADHLSGDTGPRRRRGPTHGDNDRRGYLHGGRARQSAGLPGQRVGHVRRSSGRCWAASSRSWGSGVACSSSTSRCVCWRRGCSIGTSTRRSPPGIGRSILWARCCWRRR